MVSGLAGVCGEGGEGLLRKENLMNVEFVFPWGKETTPFVQKKENQLLCLDPGYRYGVFGHMAKIMFKQIPKMPAQSSHILIIHMNRSILSRDAS